MTYKHISRLFPLAVTAAAALLFAGCGGGSSSSIDGDMSGNAAPVGSTTPQSGGGMISGSVVKGPVSGATVTAFSVGGGVMGAQIASAMTDVNGNFTMRVGNYAGPVMLQMIGGTYTDEATGAPMAMGTGDMMTAVLPPIAAGATVTGVAVTPLTAMAQAKAQHMAGGLTEANIAAANTAVGNYFMVHDIVHTQPINPLVPGSAAGVTPDMMNYGMTLAAMSQYAKGAGMSNSSGFVTAMMNDASDGVIDGKASGTQVTMGSGMSAGGAADGGMMGGSTSGATMMRPDAGRVGLSTAMNDFMNSTLNRSGVGSSSMTTLMQHLTTSGGQIR